jgi:hypothetical protein
MNEKQHQSNKVVTSYDVFISYNSRDRAVVEDIARLLEDEAGLLVWKDDWELAGGDDWVERLPEAISRARAMVIFVGPNGPGPGHKEEIKIGLQRIVKRRLTQIIPVALPGCPEDLGLPEYLDSKHCVNLRAVDAWGIHLLCCAIVGARPGRRDQFGHSIPSAPRSSIPPSLPAVDIESATSIEPILARQGTSESVKASQLLFSLERLKEPLEILVRVAGEALLRISRTWDEHDQRESGEKHLRHVYYDLCEAMASVLVSQTVWSSSENLHRRLGNLTYAEDKLDDRDALAYMLNFVMYYGGGLDNQRGIFRILAKLRPALPVDPYEMANHVVMLLLYTKIDTAKLYLPLTFYPDGGAANSFHVRLLLAVTARQLFITYPLTRNLPLVVLPSLITLSLCHADANSAPRI